MEEKEGSNPLDGWREDFAFYIASGLNRSEAYRQARPDKAKKYKYSSVWQEASREFKSIKVSSRVNYLKEEIEKERIYSMQEHYDNLKRIRDKSMTGERKDFKTALNAEIKIGEIFLNLNEEKEEKEEKPFLDDGTKLIDRTENGE